MRFGPLVPIKIYKPRAPPITHQNAFLGSNNILPDFPKQFLPPSHHTGPTSALMPHNQGRRKLRLRQPPRGRLRPQAVLPAHATHRDTAAKSFTATPLALARVDPGGCPAARCPFLCSINMLLQFAALPSDSPAMRCSLVGPLTTPPTELLNHTCRMPLPAVIYFKRL